MRFFIALLLFLALPGLPAAAQEAGPPAGQTKTPEAGTAASKDLLDQLEDESATQKKQAAPALPALKDPLLDKKKDALPYKNFSDIPEEAIVEAQKIKQDCAADPMMSRYYDCECRAMRFLEQRIKRGPEDGASAVMLDIGGDCQNLPALAGWAYNGCIHQGIDFFPAGQDPEEYCSCVGNSYAKLFARAKKSYSSRLIVEMKTLATLSCTKQPPGVPVLVPPIK